MAKWKRGCLQNSYARVRFPLKPPMKGAPDLEKTAFFAKQIGAVVRRNLGVTPNITQITNGLECTDFYINYTQDAPPWLKRALLQVLGMNYPRLTDEGQDSILKQPLI